MFFNSSVLVWITCPLLYGWLMYGNVTGSGSNYFAVIQTRSQVMYSKFCLSTGEWTVVQEELSAWTRHATFSSCSSLCRPKPSVLCETFPQQAWLRKPIIWGWFIPMISLLNMAFPLRAYDYGRVRFLLLQIFVLFANLQLNILVLQRTFLSLLALQLLDNLADYVYVIASWCLILEDDFDLVDIGMNDMQILIQYFLHKALPHGFWVLTCFDCHKGEETKQYLIRVKE